MKASIIAKLEGLVERYEEVQALLGEPSIMNDQDKYRELTKEYSQLEEVVNCFQAYQGALEDLEAAEMMLEDDDPDMREMAKDEIKEAKDAVEELADKLQILLLPKDPNDESLTEEPRSREPVISFKTSSTSSADSFRGRPTF